ncbi:MAG: hypothetical protein M3R35_06700, partial [Candidatus Eremiobacteraeota bacterium]|nr:hypothetical protein [Candidatus Eremiobacteraeota bacterium]
MLMLALVFALSQVTPAPLVSSSPSPSPSPLPSPGILVVTPALANLHPYGLQQPAVVLSITGASGDVTATLDTSVATVEIDQTAHTITLQGTQQTGRATLHVTDSTGVSADVPVRNAYDAG